jgi:hypothetical protein
MKFRYVALRKKLFQWFRLVSLFRGEYKGVVRVSLSGLPRSFDWYQWYEALGRRAAQGSLPHQVAAAIGFGTCGK